MRDSNNGVKSRKAGRKPSSALEKLLHALERNKEAVGSEIRQARWDIQPATADELLEAGKLGQMLKQVEALAAAAKELVTVCDSAASSFSKARSKGKVQN